MKRGERAAWRQIAEAAAKVAASKNYAEEYVAKMELRAGWATLHTIEGAEGIPRPRPTV